AGRSPRRTSCPRGAASRSHTACSSRGSARNSLSTRRGSSRRPRSAPRWKEIRGAGTAWTSSPSRTAIPWRRTEMATEMGRMPFFYNQEGRLVQVDYALQAVSRGSTTLGLKTKDFALLSSQVKPTRPLMEPAEKVFVVDEHIRTTASSRPSPSPRRRSRASTAARRKSSTGSSPRLRNGSSTSTTQITPGESTRPFLLFFLGFKKVNAFRQVALRHPSTDLEEPF